MPLYRKKNSPFWYYDFCFAGQRERGSTKETAKAAAKAFEAHLLERLRAGETNLNPGKRTPLLRDFIPAFIVSVANNRFLAPASQRYYKRGTQLLLQTPLKDVPLNRITRSIVASVPFPYGAATGNNAIRTLSRVLSYAVELNLLQASPTLQLYPEQGRRSTFTPEYEQRLLAVASPDLTVVFILIMDEGLRPEEACRMEWDWLLWDQNIIRIPFGKTPAAARDIAMSQRVRSMLQERLRAQAACKRTCDSRFVLPSRHKGKHIFSVNKAYRKARTAAGLPASLVLYAARHTFGTDLGAVASTRLTMAAMGHTDVKTSMRYQHPSTTRVAEIIDARNEQRSSEQRKSVPVGENGHTFRHTEPRVQ